METLLPVIYLVIVLLIFAGLGYYFYYSYRSEKKNWNGGMCTTCKAPWRSFDIDSQGVRGYKCGNGHYIWISWLNETQRGREVW